MSWPSSTSPAPSPTTIRYTLQDAWASADVDIFGGVENVFDNAPPLVSAGLSDSVTGTETAAGMYDAIGRAYYFGFTMAF